MGGFCLLVELHREGFALQLAQQACFYIYQCDFITTHIFCTVLLYKKKTYIGYFFHVVMVTFTDYFLVRLEADMEKANSVNSAEFNF